MNARRDETQLAVARFTPAIRRQAARHDSPRLRANPEEAEMTQDELHKLEGARRRALWKLASLDPGDPNASEYLATLYHLDTQEQSSALSTDAPIGLKEVRGSVPVKHHRSGINIVLEQDIPQPWKERFLQASIGSSRIADGLYARDWDKFLTIWEQEMAHLLEHRTARHKV